MKFLIEFSNSSHVDLSLVVARVVVVGTGAVVPDAVVLLKPGWASSFLSFFYPLGA